MAVTAHLIPGCAHAHRDPCGEHGPDFRPADGPQVALVRRTRGAVHGLCRQGLSRLCTSPIESVREQVLASIATDGRLPKSSASALYTDGCPRVERADKQLKHAINSAIGTLQRMRKVVSIGEGPAGTRVEVVVRLAEQSSVRVRPRGAHLVEGIPLSELARVFRELSRGQRPQPSRAGLDLQTRCSGAI
jgi:hypothetical protein